MRGRDSLGGRERRIRKKGLRQGKRRDTREREGGGEGSKTDFESRIADHESKPLSDPPPLDRRGGIAPFPFPLSLS
jgi:hypothetical protein